MIFGAFGIALVKLSSVIQFVTNFVDPSACSGVSKRLSELTTPVGLDEEVARYTGELGELRNERLVDLVGDLVHS